MLSSRMSVRDPAPFRVLYIPVCLGQYHFRPIAPAELLLEVPSTLTSALFWVINYVVIYLYPNLLGHFP